MISNSQIKSEIINYFKDYQLKNSTVIIDNNGRIETIEKKINLDLVSGCLILLVGMVYLSYNWGAHVH